MIEPTLPMRPLPDTTSLTRPEPGSSLKRVVLPQRLQRIEYSLAGTMTPATRPEAPAVMKPGPARLP